MITSERPADLPDYTNPPLHEVVIGVQFSVPGGISVIDSGLYGDLIKDDFPVPQAHPPLAPWTQPEEGVQQQISFGGAPPTPRLWLLDATGNRLIQVQEDRFIHNWRKIQGGETYPRYEVVKGEFLRRWGEFREFLQTRGKGEPDVNRMELTYVNHIEKGTCWNDVGDWPGVFSFLAGPNFAEFLPGPQAMIHKLNYPLPGSMGSLDVSITPALRAVDNIDTIQVNLMVRGPSKSVDGLDIGAWFDLGREWIVKGFTDLTQPKAHECWGRTK